MRIYKRVMIVDEMIRNKLETYRAVRNSKKGLGGYDKQRIACIFRGTRTRT